MNLDDFTQKEFNDWRVYINEHELSDEYVNLLKKVYYCKFCNTIHYILINGELYNIDKEKHHFIFVND